jgi:serpin B
MKSKLAIAISILMLMSSMMAGCGPAPTSTRPAAADTPAQNQVLPPDPAAARDAILAYLADMLAEEVPPPEEAWAEEDVTAQGLVGSSTRRYTAGDWTVTVSFPIVAPEATVYQVEVVNEASGFSWEGEVDAMNQITPIDRPAGTDTPPVQVGPAEVAILARGNNAFALDLYQLLRGQEGNLFYSPYSIQVALAMTYAGARGETEAQMADALHFDLDQARLHPAFAALAEALASRGQALEDEEAWFRLNVANSLWGQEGYAFVADYLALVDGYYGGGLRQVDFVGAPEEARQQINDWVEGATEDKIQDLIPQGAITPLTRLVLANAIYFNATWAQPFADSRTGDGSFYLLDGSQVTVPLMHQTESMPYSQGDGYQAVEMHYAGNELSMVALLPDQDRFEEFEAALDMEQLEAILGDLDYGQVALTMPRFEFESEFNLNDALAGLGMAVAFSDRADFSSMTGNRELSISDVVHKAFVAVDEEGTEAAAATAVMMALSAAPAEPVEVRLDRPFLFLIRDVETGTVLFLGRVVDPSQ